MSCASSPPRSWPTRRPGQTLQATALVHEAYLRLVGGDKAQGWDGRGHFFAAAAEAMRRILVERARRKRRRKHGGGSCTRIRTWMTCRAGNRDPLEVIGRKRGAWISSRQSAAKAELVKLRYFLGCTMAEAAQVLGIAQSTAEEDWTYSKAWLRRKLAPGRAKEAPSENHQGFQLRWRMGI